MSLNIIMIETRWDQSLEEGERSSVWQMLMLSKTLRTPKTFSQGMLWRDFVWFGWVCFEDFVSNGKLGRLKSLHLGLISPTITIIIPLINTLISSMIAFIITLIITLISAIITLIKSLFISSSSALSGKVYCFTFCQGFAQSMEKVSAGCYLPPNWK